MHGRHPVAHLIRLPCTAGPRRVFGADGRPRRRHVSDGQETGDAECKRDNFQGNVTLH